MSSSTSLSKSRAIGGTLPHVVVLQGVSHAGVSLCRTARLPSFTQPGAAKTPVNSLNGRKLLPLFHPKWNRTVITSKYPESGRVSAAESRGCPEHQKRPIHAQSEDGHSERNEKPRVDRGHRQRPLVHGFVEIHRLYDPRVIEERHRAVQDADHGQQHVPEAAPLHDRREDEVLPDEACEWRDPGQAEEEHRQG